MAGSALLRQLQERVAPVALASEQRLAVPEALQSLFGSDGLPRGSSVGFRGVGGWSMALALAASALGADGWLAVLGVEELGLVAASEAGIRLDRVLVVSPVSSSQLGMVAATLMDAVDVLVLAPRSPVGAGDARRLVARARERGTVLFHLDGGAHWPEPLDLTITAATGLWEGIGQGHGHLQLRPITLSSLGRRGASRLRSVTVMAGGPDGSTLTPIPDPASASDPAPASDRGPTPVAPPLRLVES